MNDSATTRRDFLKHSFAACTAAALAAEPSSTASAAALATKPDVDAEPLTPYGGGDAIYLSDLGRCEPATALARKWRRGHWRLMDYQADGVAGTLLAVGQNTGVPDVSLPLHRQGWHAVYFGLLSKYTESRLEVRLAREATFSLLTHQDMLGQNLERRDIELGGHLRTTRHFDELFWRCVEFREGDSIVLRQLKVRIESGDSEAPGNRFMPCWLGYLKLVPLTDSEVVQLLADKRRRDTRRLYAHNDGFGSPSWLRFRDEADIRREIEPYRGTDFSRMYWEAGMGDLTFYPSRVGSLFTLDWTESQYRLRDRLVAETYADFREQGVDPFRVALESCRDADLEFHAAYRVAGFHFPAPEDEWNAPGLFVRHPEWRGVDREGRLTPRLSYAFPGVRSFVLNLLEEMAENYPLDGLALLYNRRMPLLEYELPLIDGFRARHGVDPRQLAADDPRWLAHRAGVMTDFMRELRRRLDAIAFRRGRSRLAVTTVVLSSPAENLENALDLAAWVRERLVDTLVPYSSVPGLPSEQASWIRASDLDPFVALTRGTACELVPNLMPRQIAPEDYRRRALELYERGADGLFLWDCYQRNNFDPSWSALRRLGHRDELAAWRHRGEPSFVRPRMDVRQIGEWNMAYGTPG